MARKKTQTKTTNTCAKKASGIKKEIKNSECKVILNKSLPILSSEKISVSDSGLDTEKVTKAKLPVAKMDHPQIKLSCKPLNFEKVIKMESNLVDIRDIQKLISLPICKKAMSLGKPTTKRRTQNVPKKEVTVKENKTAVASRKRAQISNDDKTVDNKRCKSNRQKNVIKIKVQSLSKPCISDAGAKPPVSDAGAKPLVSDAGAKPPVSGTETKPSASYTGTKPVLSDSSNIQKINNKQATKPEKSSQSFSMKPNMSFGSAVINTSEFPSDSNWSDLNDESFIDINDMYLEELAPCLEELNKEEVGVNGEENLKEKNNEFTDINDYRLESQQLNVKEQSSEIQCNNNVESFSKPSLQALVEAFMKSPQLKYLKENTALKKGLCFAWLSNNYVCPNKECQYSHNALNLFTKKLKQYPSKFIMTVVVSMRHDILFVDVIMAAFKIISERKVPTIWVTFLIFFVFYVTEPSDSRFLKFWANSARFFCQFNENYAAASGFASLLSIFSQGDKSDEWKIIEFIKLIKQPPVQVSTSYALLQPVLKMNLPLKFLTDAVEYCITTQKDIMKVYTMIIPKIQFMTSPIDVIELLLKFCKTLEECSYQTHANNLKQRLQAKVVSMKTKVTRRDYPLTAFFQEQISRNSSGNSTAILNQVLEDTPKTILAPATLETKYFQLEDDFCNQMTEAMELSPNAMPSPFKSSLNPNDIIEAPTQKDDVCERQVNRIRQFFQDYQFDLLAKYLNELRPNAVDLAAEEFLKLLFQMEISINQLMDLIKIILLPCKSKSASEVAASVCVTIVLNLITNLEWGKAYTIVTSCQEKQINLVNGKVFYFNKFSTTSQCRIVLVLVEIYSYKKDFLQAVDLVKKYSLFSPNSSVWGLTFTESDEGIRIKILEDLLQRIVDNQITEVGYDLFEMIWREQKQLVGLVDLRKFINEMLILLLNEDKEDAVTLFEKIKAEATLNNITVRAILVTLVKRNRLSSAKSLLFSPNQKAYAFPDIISGSAVVKVSSYWVEEEIYALFDALFDALAEKRNFVLTDLNVIEIQIDPEKAMKNRLSKLRPLCLSFIKADFQDACSRIQRVLQYQFNPPLKLIVMPYSLKLEEYSVKLHLYKRMGGRIKLAS